MSNSVSSQPLPVHPPRIGPATLCATLSLNLLALALPLVVLQVFDRVIPFEAVETLAFLFLGLCVVAILEFVLKWSRAVLLSSKAEQFETKLCQHFIDATLNADPESFGKTTPAAHMDKMGAIAQLRAFYGGQARILSIDLPFTLVFISMIGLIGGWLVLVPLASIALLFLFKTALTKAQSSVFEKRKTLDGRRYSFLVEVLSQIKTLKANTMEPQMQRRYELLQDQTADISHRVILFSGFSQTFGALFSQIAVAAMGLLGGYLVISNNIGIAELAACMLLNGRTVQPMLKALGLWAQSESLEMAKSKVTEACNVEQRPRVPSLSKPLVGHIQFDDLSLQHGNRETPLFQNLSGDISPGECLGLKGNNGAGKSAFHKIILAEVSPSSGTLTIDGFAPEKLINERGAGGIVYVDQSPVFFVGSVLENISAFGDGEMIETALELSELLGLNKILHRLPMGYNTPIHDSQALLHNQNFLQGVTLVRAMALKPHILLLNNATTPLDNGARTKLRSALVHMKGETTIVLSDHDEALMQLADRHITMDDPATVAAHAWAEDLRRDTATNATIDHKRAS